MSGSGLGSVSDSDSYYRRLDVGEAASREDIVHAYRRLAFGTHPDSRPHDPEAPGRFREIAEAYEVLVDPDRRAAYDRRLRVARFPAAARAPLRVDDLGVDKARSAGDIPAHVVDPPVFLGTARLEPARDVTLRIGPARVVRRRHGAADQGVALTDMALADVHDLLRRLAGSWWAR